MNRRRWWILAVVSLASLMVMLDLTIVNVALPRAQHAMGLSDSGRQWVVTAYSLAFGGLLLAGGRIADRVGARRTLLIGVAGFAVASAVGGAATGPAMLISGRAAQGAFAALLSPPTLSLLAVTFTEPAERAKAFGLFSAILGGGGAVGLIAGGLLTSAFDWRWCLYLNTPVALAALVAAAVLLPAVPGHRDAPLDLPGAALGGAATVALVYGLATAGTHGWGAPAVLGTLAAAAVLAAAFAVRQRRARHPLLPPRLLSVRTPRAGAVLAITVTMGAMFGMFLFMTYLLQVVMRYSPLATGAALLPAAVTTVLTASQLAARLLPRMPARYLIVPGMLVAAAGMLLLGRCGAGTPYATGLLPAEVVLGLGAGCVMTPSVTLAMGGVPARDAGVMSAVLGTAQQVGGSVGVALLNTVAAVHGYGVASVWAAVALAVGAAGVGALLRPQPSAGSPASTSSPATAEETVGSAAPASRPASRRDSTAGPVEPSSS
jgi:EmrB/QacA subfamily drug resistance transporter